jgi:hypothetical protein
MPDVVIGEAEQKITKDRRDQYLIGGTISVVLGIVLVAVGFYAGLPRLDCGLATCRLIVDFAQNLASSALMLFGGLALGIGIVLLAIGFWLGRYAWVIR